MLNFLEKHLDKVTPCKRWEFFFLEAYAPGKTDNVSRFCWSRRYILVTHGGGASMVRVPEYCPEEAPDCKQMRKITMLVEDRKTIWLCTEDMEWAVRYLWVQNMLKGVPLVSADCQGPSDEP